MKTSIRNEYVGELYDNLPNNLLAEFPLVMVHALRVAFMAGYSRQVTFEDFIRAVTGEGPTYTLPGDRVPEHPIRQDVLVKRVARGLRDLGDR